MLRALTHLIKWRSFQCRYLLIVVMSGDICTCNGNDIDIWSVHEHPLTISIKNKRIYSEDVLYTEFMYI